MNRRTVPGAEPFRFDAGPVGALLQHGFSGSPASMRPMGRWLSERGVSVIGPRLPGHGTSWEELESTTWQDWERESERALDELSARCDTVVLVGLSMGASMVLHLAAKRPEVTDGVVAINADLRRPQLVLAPLVRLFMRTAKGVANDIKKPGQTETAYDRIPLKAANQLGKLYRTVERQLPSIRAPLLVLSSAEDHVSKPSNSRFVLQRAGSERKELISLPNSYHVATLDYDAPDIFERTLRFATSVAAGPADATAAQA